MNGASYEASAFARSQDNGINKLELEVSRKRTRREASQ